MKKAMSPFARKKIPQMFHSPSHFELKKPTTGCFPLIGLSGWMETKQKQKRKKTSVHHPRLPLLAAEALWRV